MTDTPEGQNAHQQPDAPPDGSAHRSPAAVVVGVFGSAAEVARILGLSNSTTWRWLESGLVPAQYHRTLMAEAAKRSLTLTADDLVNGRG